MKAAKQLIKDLPLNINDIARLTLEAVEALDSSSYHLERLAMLQILRWVIAEGVRAIHLAERTVTFREASRQSIESRAGRHPATCRD